MRKVSFRFSIIQSYLLLTLVTTTVICSVFYVYSKEAVITLANKIINEVSSKTNEQVADFISTPEMQEQVISRLVTETNIISQEKLLLKILWELIQVQPEIESLSIADSQGNYLQARHFPKPATRTINRMRVPARETIIFRDNNFGVLGIEHKDNPSFDPRNRPWYKEVGNEQRTYWTEPYVANTTRQIVVSGTRPIISNGERIGVANFNIPLSRLSEFMSKQQVSANGIAFLVGVNGDLLAFPDNQFQILKDAGTGELRIGKIEDLTQEWIKEGWRHYKKNGTESFSFLVGGTPYLANFSKLTNPSLSNWRIGIMMPESDVTGAVHEILIIASTVALAIFLFSLFPMIWFARNLSRPIAELVDQTKQLKEFQLENIRVVDSPITEMNTLSNSIFAAAQGLKSFQKYIPAELVRQLLSTGEATKIGGESRYLTMLFSDLQDFSTLSENTPSQELLTRISSYFEIFVTAINEERGYVDKFIGDSVMAFWGAPLPQHDHAYHACVAAVKSHRRMQLLNENLIKAEKPALIVRIGLHSDAVLVGNVGSSEKLSYTVMGDGVNIASRLEGMNKEFGTGICISHSLYKEAGERLWVRPIDTINIKGRKGEILIYELMGIRDDSNETGISDRAQELLKSTERAFQLYNNKNFGEAVSEYQVIAEKFNDTLAKVMAQRAHSKQK